MAELPHQMHVSAVQVALLLSMILALKCSIVVYCSPVTRMATSCSSMSPTAK